MRLYASYSPMGDGGRQVKRFATGVAVLVAVGLVFCTGFAFRDLASRRGVSQEAFARLFGLTPKQKETPTVLFTRQYNSILAKSLVPIDAEVLKHRAMEGMFASLGDPHTNFLEPVAAEDLKLETRGDFVGIGARLSPDPIGARVATVFKGAPAEKAGLKPGDMVVSVDGVDAAGEDVNEVVAKIRGKAGTKVNIRVVRPNVAKPLDISIVRDIVVIPTAEGRMLEPDHFGYLAVSQFAETTPIQFSDALDDLIQQRPKGLVIDLRGNPGGLLPAVSDMLGAFLDSKEVISMKLRDGSKQTATTPRGKTKSMPFPVVVLVNEESASASEIFAGVLQDYQHATIMGEHTYGKASVQTVFTLVDGPSAKITLARYYLPSGRNIERKVDEDGQYISGGLAPDIVVPLQIEDDTLLGEPGRDSQLDLALEHLRQTNGR
ncbi:MAG: S41 family peptidase [Fimbriimonadaceae bacterium]